MGLIQINQKPLSATVYFQVRKTVLISMLPAGLMEIWEAVRYCTYTGMGLLLRRRRFGLFGYVRCRLWHTVNGGSMGRMRDDRITRGIDNRNLSAIAWVRCKANILSTGFERSIPYHPIAFHTN